MNVAVISLKYAPGHVAHIRAYLLLFEQLGCDVSLVAVPEYENEVADIECNKLFTEDVSSQDFSVYDRVVLYNLSFDNIKIAGRCRRAGVRVYYILHEPWPGLRKIAKEGKGKNIFWALCCAAINAVICNRSYKVILASNNAMTNYRKYMRHCNGRCRVFPLIFEDKYSEPESRRWVSYIGAFYPSHGCTEFLDFVGYAVRAGLGLEFLIASKDDVSGYILQENADLKSAVEQGILTICEGRSFSLDEINYYYRNSICVWNAYTRSTQSGVMINALMNGTPVITNDNGSAHEIIKNNSEGVFISWPPVNDEVAGAVSFIKDNFQRMSIAARECFEAEGDYMHQLAAAQKVYDIN